MAKIRNYTPRSSAYSVAHGAICREYEKNKYHPLSEKRVQEVLESTPGICFAAGTDLDEALTKLETWRLIFRGKIFGLEGKSIVPLRWDRRD